MKRYLVFGFDQYYPNGGWNDFICSTNTLEEARLEVKARTHDNDYFQIVDLETHKVVE